MVFFDNKHKVSQEIHALKDNLVVLTNDVAELSKLVLAIATTVENREKRETRKEVDDEILMAILARSTSDKTH